MPPLIANELKEIKLTARTQGATVPTTTRNKITAGATVTTTTRNKIITAVIGTICKDSE